MDALYAHIAVKAIVCKVRQISVQYSNKAGPSLKTHFAMTEEIARFLYNHVIREIEIISGCDFFLFSFVIFEPVMNFTSVNPLNENYNSIHGRQR